MTADRLRELVELNRFIASTLEYEDVLERVVAKTADITGADACLLLLAGGDGMARVAASRGLAEEQTRAFASPLDERISGELMRLLGFRREDVFLGVPVIDHGSVLGMLAVYRRGPGATDAEEEYLVSALADQAAIALEHAARYRQVSDEKDRHLRLLQAIQANTTTFLAYLDRELRFVEANAGFCKTLGALREELLGRRFGDVANTPAVVPLLDGVLRNGEPIEAQVRLQRADGVRGAREMYWNVGLRPVLGGGDRIDGVVVSATDVTEEVLARKEVERANRRKDEFLAMLGHELRNPVAAIASAAEVIKMAEPDAPVEAEVRDLVYRQVRHMARLLDDLLDVSRITRGTIALKPVRIDLRDVVALSLQSARQLIRSREQRLEVDLPPLPVWIDGDIDRLVQALSNLLTNAGRYTADGGRIEVTMAPEAGGVALRVRDSGEGISPEDLPFLFEPFLQSKRGLDRPGGGLGLGLTLVKQLVELHDGHVSVHSDGPGRGSEFTIWLPRARGAAAAAEGGESSVARPGRRTVLIVEDNADFASSLQALLRAEGHAVSAVNDGVAALEAMARKAPDVVLLDIGLPGMDGFELARRIRELSGEAPLLIAISGYGREDDRRAAREAGIDHYLVKPLWHDALCSLLAERPAQRAS